MNEKIDFKISLKNLYAPSREAFSVVEAPALQFLMIDGHGDPNRAPSYSQAVEALYTLSYGLKNLSKKTAGQDYVVAPLEGLWWVEDMAKFSAEDKDSWDWTMMILQPEWITPGMFAEAAQAAAKKKELPALPKVRLETYHEGLSVQILHIGPYSAEGPTLQRLHKEFLPAHGFEPTGKHHEIYLSDPNRVAPEKLKTILRQPVRPIA
jgi:hypothetical protein